jgi:hypothetical protein
MFLSAHVNYITPINSAHEKAKLVIEELGNGS